MDLSGIETVAIFIALVASLLEMSIFVEVLASWFGNAYQKGRFRLFFEGVNAPYLGIIRRFVPGFGGIDFSPLVGILILEFGTSFLLRLMGVNYAELMSKINL
ncbi:YggT family protein [Patescibacteria group bacterium]|nr:YggT family protein [Patescibacteria group bacterium]